MRLPLNNGIQEYLNDYGDCIHSRSWSSRYVYGHAPYNNEHDCYHEWLRWVEEHKEELCAQSTFEDILQELHKKEMKGIGPLVRYDTATQLAFPQEKYPNQVHFYAGSAKGAKALGIKGCCADKQVFVEICSAFAKLSTAQIEDFLCVYSPYLTDDKERIQKIESSRRNKCGEPKNKMPGRCR